MTTRYDPEFYPEPKPDKSDDSPDPVKDYVRHMYSNLRNDIVDLEEFISSSDLTEDEIKRLDKSVTLLKVGSKYIKKFMRERGVKTKVLVR